MADQAESRRWLAVQSLQPHQVTPDLLPTLLDAPEVELHGRQVLHQGDGQPVLPQVDRLQVPVARPAGVHADVGQRLAQVVDELLGVVFRAAGTPGAAVPPRGRAQRAHQQPRAFELRLVAQDAHLRRPAAPRTEPRKPVAGVVHVFHHGFGDRLQERPRVELRRDALELMAVEEIRQEIRRGGGVRRLQGPCAGGQDLRRRGLDLAYEAPEARHQGSKRKRVELFPAGRSRLVVERLLEVEELEVELEHGLGGRLARQPLART